jgi:branched-chain amino acid transport system permease protein
MSPRLLGGLTLRSAAMLAALGLAALLAPLVVDDYVLTVLTLVLYAAFVGQAWNIIMGFAGQLSLGHSLYVGLGAYVSATLFIRYGIPPLLGAFAAMAVAMIAGALLGFLAFRFRVGGVYFALLTIAFAEFTRIGFDHFELVGGSAGLFLKVEQRTVNDIVNLRGTPGMFYYVLLGLTVGALALCRVLLNRRIGYYWLAIREDIDAAETLGIDTFRYRMYAVMLSAALTSLAGVFFAFYYNNLFPEQIFSIARSIEIILGPIIGGLGTLIGPILGAGLLTLLGESLDQLLPTLGLSGAGYKLLVYGLCLLAVVMFLPNGVWPWLARLLGVDNQGGRR